MKRSLQLLCLSFALTILLCSCSSVYVDLEKPDTTGIVEVDPEDEYFTDGGIYTQFRFDPKDGFVYGDSWYYIETQKYTIKTVEYEGDVKHESTKHTYINRIVKVNAETGTVSSPCLDPVCTHSVGSTCPMMEPEDAGLRILMIANDWMIIELNGNYDKVYGSFDKVFAYNLISGNIIDIYDESFVDSIATDWEDLSLFDGKIYLVKHVLDYSKTKFNPENEKALSEYEPETQSYLYEYNLDNNSYRELFDIPDGARVHRLTNKRFLLYYDETFYTCSLDGTNLQPCQTLDFIPDNKMGYLAFSPLENGYKFYDIRTDEITEVNIEEFKFEISYLYMLTVEGIYFHTLTSREAYNAERGKKQEFYAQHPDKTTDELSLLFAKHLHTILYSGKSQFWRCDHDGGNLELAFEWENSTSRFIGNTDKIFPST